MNLLIPIAAMALLGLIFGVGLAYALKLFGIEVDPTISMIIAKLPGSNCGACGKAGCVGFAEALKNGEAMPSGCAVSNEESRISIAQILGIDYNPKVKTIAAVLCNGGDRSKNKYAYTGLRNCKAASLIFGGHKACAFGCLGLGDCVDICPFDAITMGADALPIVDAHKCTACGKCIGICPKKLFELIPLDKLYYVKCISTDAGAAVTKVCSAGCIGCRKCEKACPQGVVSIDNNLAKINYGKCQNKGKCFEVCPTKVIAKR